MDQGEGETIHYNANEEETTVRCCNVVRKGPR
jgi:hypothetical protein